MLTCSRGDFDDEKGDDAYSDVGLTAIALLLGDFTRSPCLGEHAQNASMVGLREVQLVRASCKDMSSGCHYTVRLRSLCNDNGNCNNASGQFLFRQAKSPTY